MQVHKRTICHDCGRQWVNPIASFVNSAPVSITGNNRPDLCGICGSCNTKEVEYTPTFLGGDYGVELFLPPEVSAEDLPEIKSHVPGFIANALTIEKSISENDTEKSIQVSPQLKLLKSIDSIESNPAYDLSDMD
jgi:hypothetical protein